MEAIARRETDKPVKRDDLAERAAKLQSLMVAADKNPKKLPELNTFLRENRDLAETIIVLAETVKINLIEKIHGSNNKGMQVVVFEEVTALTRKLSGDEVSPLEKLLVDCVVMCWLRVQHAEHYRTNLSGRRTFKTSCAWCSDGTATARCGCC